MTLAVAKQAARKEQQKFEVSPVKGYTLRDAFTLWCNLKRGRIVSYRDEKRRLEHYIMSKIGSRQLDEIKAPLVIKTVRSIESAGKLPTLKRTLMRLREILDLAVCAGYIEHNPILNVSRVFAPPKVRSMPSMSWQELPFILEILKPAPIRLKNYFLFSLCSMLRPGEVAKLQKDWIIDNTITIPASEMKKGRQHRLPITRYMQDLLNRENNLSPHPRNKFLFAGRKAGAHISKQALAKYLHQTELKEKLVPHGLRSMARCWLADNGIQFEVAESCLSHTVGDQVYKAYQRSDFLEQRRQIYEKWCNYIQSCAQSANFLEDCP